MPRGVKFNLMPGERFGKLQIVRYLGKCADRKSNPYLWECKCDCGNITRMRAAHLMKSKSSSCGCQHTQKPDIAAMRLVYHATKAAAIKTRSLEFTLSLDEWFKLTQSPCFYCGAEKTNCYTPKPKNKNYIIKPFYYNGLDRVDNSRGYVPDNVVPCCKQCNFSKRDNTKEDFLNWLEQAYLHTRKKIGATSLSC